MASKAGNRIGWGLAAAAWLGAVCIGLGALWRYQTIPGEQAPGPATWPVASAAAHSGQCATLLMFVHPRCPCTRASIGELAELMAHLQGRVEATVLFVRPEGAGPGWEDTDLWRSAAAIPGVRTEVDDLGREARRFGARTSGEVQLFGADGGLLFRGGITEARGHAGDNDGCDAILALLDGGAAPRPSPRHPGGAGAGAGHCRRGPRRRQDARVWLPPIFAG